MSINRVVISGNITRDPELRRTQSGMAILSLGIAVNDRRRNSQTGEWEDYTNFIDCTMFGSRAESLSNILVKGMKVAIDGKLRYSQWERDGQRRSKIEVVIDEIDLMTARGGRSNNSKGNNNADNNTNQQDVTPAEDYQAAPAPAIDDSSSVYDDDIPF